MRITQCYISQSIKNFPFREKYGLSEYHDKTSPCIFFGLYRKEDLQAVLQHTGLCVIRWSGVDALSFRQWRQLKRQNIHHITPFVANHTILLRNDLNCKLIPPAKLDRKSIPLKLGNSIYAYCPSPAKPYHRYDLIEQLSKSFNVIVGDGTIPMKDWPSVADSYYSKCFAGVVLNNHAGGGASIIEMGIRGMRVVTNVFDLPHTIKWQSYEDVESFLINEKERATGTINHHLADQVCSVLDDEMKYIYTDFYE